MTLLITISQLIACSTHPKIYLYSDDISPTVKQSLDAELKKNQLSLIEATTPPSGVSAGNYIIYTPNRDSDKVVTIINEALDLVGLKQATTVAFNLGSGIGAHTYTSGNFGLYLLAQDHLDGNDRDISAKDDDEDSYITKRQFGSINCGDIKILEFNADQTFVLVDQDTDKILIKGKWELVGGRVRLGHGIRSQKFDRDTKIVNINDETFTAVDLKPDDKNRKPFECTYSTYFIEGIYHK
jgi:hypothetical protein